MQQESFFEQLEVDVKTRYLCVVFNDKIVDMTIEDIFSSERFNEIFAITYVSSSAFFSKIVKGFSKVKILLGIEDTDHLENFTEGLSKLIDIKERTDFWNELSTDLKEKVFHDEISLRFSSNSPIHTKLYLLNNSNTGEKRVVIGSANLTETAFSNKKQYEDIIIFDNDEAKYNLYYNQRFKPIFESGINYIPDKVKNINFRETPVFLLDKETAAEILNMELESNRRKICVLTEEQMSELKARPQQIEKKYELIKEEIERETNIIKQITKKVKEGYVIKPLIELKKNTINIQTLITKTTKGAEEDIRQLFKYWDKTDALLVVDKNNPNVYKPFSEPISKDEIKNSLLIINKFVDAYKLFTFESNITYQSKIMEIILFSFMSPFIWKLREEIVVDTSSESNRSTFPVFLIIAGRAASGKTTALEFVGMLLGNNSPFFMPYSAIQKGRTVDKNLLEGYFGAEYLSPVLIDEIPSSFFTGKTGENVIKDISNNTNGKHPVLIGTTNIRDFNTSSQVLRRIYYIQVDSEFNIKEFNTDSKKYLNEIKSQISNSLFKDFTYRVGLKIKDNEQIYKESDVLDLARKIFIEYFNESDLTIPEWFPTSPFYDYEQRGQTIWRTLYLNNKEFFKDRLDGTVYVDTSIFKNPNEKANCVNFLGNGCIKEDTQVLLLHSEMFYKYVSISPKSSLLSKVKHYVGV